MALLYADRFCCTWGMHHYFLLVNVDLLTSTALSPVCIGPPFVGLATSHYARSEKRTHHEFELFLATTIDSQSHLSVLVTRGCKLRATCNQLNPTVFDYLVRSLSQQLP